MKKHVHLVSLVLLVSFFLSACGTGQLFGPTLTPTPTSTSTPTMTPSVTPSPLPTATPTPGIGVAVAGEKYQITIVSIRQENKITGFSGDSWTPKSGYAFLVVTVKFRSLDKTPPSVASNQVAIVRDDKAIRIADGVYGACVNCKVTNTAGPSTDELEVGFVFVLKEDELNQTFKFQFQDIPLIPFRLE